MFSYIARNLIYSVVIIIGVLTVTFCLLYIVPGDPARMMLGQRADVASVEAVREELGLNKPVYVMHKIYVKCFSGRPWKIIFYKQGSG